MSSVRQFEDLHIYQHARELTRKVYEFTRNRNWKQDLELASQIRRAAISVMSNIAEGFERGTKLDFSRFLYMAKGSCGEVRAQLTVAFDQRYMNQSQHEELVGRCRQISAMLNNLIVHLERTEMPARHKKRTRKSSVGLSHQDLGEPGDEQP